MASTYLTRTPSSAGNRKTFTLSTWIKRSNLSDGAIIGARSSSTNRFRIGFTSNRLDVLNVASSTTYNLTTTMLFRDVSAWYHIVVAYDTTQATASNRIKVYVNGTEQTAFVNSGYPPQNTDTDYNNTFAQYIGTNDDASGEFFDGYFAHTHLTDGTAYAASTFGSTSTNGQWVPNLAPSVTYGTNGFFLNFKNASDLGEDSSGNNNDFTKSGSGDKIPDCPANVFATFNPLDLPASMNLTNGGLSANNTANDMAATGNMGFTSGKWYWEFYWASGVSPEMGLKPNIKSLCNVTEVISSNFDVCAFISSNGSMRDPAWATVDTTGLSSQTAESVIAVAVDADNGKMWVSDGSGTYFNSGNPATGANPQATFDSDWVTQTNGVVPYTLIGTGGDKSVLVNFGQDSSFAGAKTAGTNTDENGNGNFYYSVPSGYNALCTNSMATELTQPIGKGGSYFNTLTWSGDGSTRNITGVGFSPDWVWIKCRSASAGHVAFDTVRGASKRLVPNSTGAETTTNEYGFVTAFGTDGFTLTPGNQGVYASGDVNMSGRTYVGWNWRGSDSSAVSNTDGSITSTVSANQTSGFSIVTYTGNGSSATVGHSLGTTPSMIIIKERGAAGEGWNVYTKTLGAGNYLMLQSINDSGSSTSLFDNTEPTSSLFSVGVDAGTNGNTKTYIAYCFAEIEGYSKFGSYTGNGSTNGTFVHTGFRPSFFMTKPSSTTGEWTMYDSTRDTFNVADRRLVANTTDSEYNNGNGLIDFLSNGFKMRVNHPSNNTSGTTYVYMAFAENPFVDSSGIPVTAR